jgi:epoxide hydrolase 4
MIERVGYMCGLFTFLILIPGKKKFILVAHDWGAVVGWHFVYKHMDMIER